MINELTLVFFRKSFGLWDALILISGLIFFLSMIYAAYRAVMTLQKGQNKARLMEEKILPELFSKFGKVISIEAVQLKRVIKFERNGTLFELKVTTIPDSNGNVRELMTEIKFNLPNLHEQFYIQQNTLFLSKNPSDCQEVQLPMPKDFVFHSENPQFLANLVAKDNIRNEIYKYQKKVSREFSIDFASGVLTVTWVRGRDDGSDTVSWDDSWENENPEEEVKRLEQICQTAVVFYDEISKNEQGFPIKTKIFGI